MRLRGHASKLTDCPLRRRLWRHLCRPCWQQRFKVNFLENDASYEKTVFHHFDPFFKGETRTTRFYNGLRCKIEKIERWRRIFNFASFMPLYICREHSIVSHCWMHTTNTVNSASVHAERARLARRKVKSMT